MNGYENAACANAAVEAFGFILRDTHPYEGSHQPADCAARTHAGQSRHDRSGRDKWAESGNRQRAQSDEEAKSASERSAGANTSGNALRGFCVFLVREVFAPCIVGEQYRDVFIPEVRREQGFNSQLDLPPVGIETECCYIFS